jgi:hypothetical protein
VSAVTDILGKLSTGQITEDDATSAFSDMDWPTTPPPARTLADIETDPDPRAAEPGDFGEVESAYINGKITLPQYERFASAASGGAVDASTTG